MVKKDSDCYCLRDGHCTTYWWAGVRQLNGLLISLVTWPPATLIHTSHIVPCDRFLLLFNKLLQT